MRSNKLKLLIFYDFLNVIDEDTLFELLKIDWNLIKYVKNPSENIQLKIVNLYGFLIEHIKDPSETVQFEAIRNQLLSIKGIKKPTKNVQFFMVNELVNSKAFNDEFNTLCNSFMSGMGYEKITCSKCLKILYNKVPDCYKEIIKSHPNYKSDAELILEVIK